MHELSVLGLFLGENCVDAVLREKVSDFVASVEMGVSHLVLSVSLLQLLNFLDVVNSADVLGSSARELLGVELVDLLL